MTNPNARPVFAEFPAYKIVAPFNGRKGHPVMFSDVEVMIEIKNFRGEKVWRRFAPMTAASYAIKYGEDPIKAHNETAAKGQPTHWVNSCGAMIHNGPKTQEVMTGFRIGDVVQFEGQFFTIRPANNDNVSMVPVAE